MRKRESTKPRPKGLLDWQPIALWTAATQRAAGGWLYYRFTQGDFHKSTVFRPENAVEFALPMPGETFDGVG